MKKALYIFGITLLVISFLASSVYLATYFLQGKKQADRYDQLSTTIQDAQQNVTRVTDPTQPEETEATQPTEPGEKKMLPGLDELYRENPDLVGWITIEGTKLNYPVMQTSVDNANYYLYRDFDKQDANRGSIYAREECDIFAPSDNITLYGHNMKDGSMFACLGEYYEKDFWRDNSLIFFDDLYNYHVYKIFAVFKTSASIGEGFAYHRFENAANEEEFNAFVSECKQLSFYDTGITPVYGDKLICLSTCEYTLDNGRFVVAAVRIS